MYELSDLTDLLGLSIDELEKLGKDFPNLVKKRRKRKKAGAGYRLYLDPDKRLLRVQRSIKKNILSSYKVPSSIRGLGGPRGSHVANAAEHARNKDLIHLDIANFYDVVTASNVFAAFKSKLGFDASAAKLLTALTSFQGRLWQGLATSSHLAAICTSAFTIELEDYAKRMNLTFTQYGDDLFFSGEHIKSPDGLTAFVIGRAKAHKLSVRRQKIEVDRSGVRSVTGALSGRASVRAKRKMRNKTELLAKLYSRYGKDGVEAKLKGSLLFLKQCRPNDAKAIAKKYRLKF